MKKITLLVLLVALCLSLCACTDLLDLLEMIAPDETEAPTEESTTPKEEPTTAEPEKEAPPAKEATEELEYRSNNDGTCVVTGIGKITAKEIVIPEVAPNGDRVVAIAEGAFKHALIHSVDIPGSIKTISAEAF